MVRKRTTGATLAAGVAFSLVSGSAIAATVTFDNLIDYDTMMGRGVQSHLYREAGVRVSTLDLGYLYSGPASSPNPGTAHIDDAGTDATSGLLFNMQNVFSASSFSLWALDYDYVGAQMPTDNIIVTGLRHGATVVSASYTMSYIAGTYQTIALGAAFSGLDALTISLVQTGTGFCGAPCAHFDLDEVVLNPTAAPVPLPAGFGLLGAAGAALAALRLRRRPTHRA